MPVPLGATSMEERFKSVSGAVGALLSFDRSSIVNRTSDNPGSRKPEQWEISSVCMRGQAAATAARPTSEMVLHPDKFKFVRAVHFEHCAARVLFCGLHHP